MLKRLSPVIHRYNLGYVRLWQDDLAEIVRLMRQINGVDVRVESDNYLIEDIKNDLPQLGRRLDSFKAAVYRTHGGSAIQLMELRLSRDSCEIEATDPDLTTLGAIDQITKFTGRRRRGPRWLVRFFRSSPAFRWDKFTAYSLAISVFTYIVSLAVASVLIGLIHINHRSDAAVPEWLVIVLAAPAGVLFACMLFGYSQARTVLFSGTRAEAPTWWQKYRSEIGISVVVGVVFYLLGFLTAHS